LINNVTDFELTEFADFVMANEKTAALGGRFC